MSAQSLLIEIKKHLPLRAYGNGPVVEMMRELGLHANKKTHHFDHRSVAVSP